MLQYFIILDFLLVLESFILLLREEEQNFIQIVINLLEIKDFFW